MLVIGNGWHTAEYVAAFWGKHVHTVRDWCADGFLVSCGFKVAHLHDRAGNRRYWIYGVEMPNSPIAQIEQLIEQHGTRQLDPAPPSHAMLSM